MFCLEWAKCYQFSPPSWSQFFSFFFFPPKWIHCLIFWFVRLTNYFFFRTLGKSAAGWRVICNDRIPVIKSAQECASHFLLPLESFQFFFESLVVSSWWENSSWRCLWSGKGLACKEMERLTRKWEKLITWKLVSKFAFLPLFLCLNRAHDFKCSHFLLAGSLLKIWAHIF